MVKKAVKGALITLKDMRIAKLDKRMRNPRCEREFEALLNSLYAVSNDESKVPVQLQLALSNCLKSTVSLFVQVILFSGSNIFKYFQRKLLINLYQ